MCLFCLHLEPSLFLDRTCILIDIYEYVCRHVEQCSRVDEFRTRIYNEDLVITDRGIECSICLENIDRGQTIARLECLCIYHKNCIDSWLNKNASCPGHPPPWWISTSNYFHMSVSHAHMYVSQYIWDWNLNKIQSLNVKKLDNNFKKFINNWITYRHKNVCNTKKNNYT